MSDMTREQLVNVMAYYDQLSPEAQDALDRIDEELSHWEWVDAFTTDNEAETEARDDYTDDLIGHVEC